MALLAQTRAGERPDLPVPPLSPRALLSILWSDMYKHVMQIAGFPLRPETFQFVMRKGGPWVIPMDLEPLIRAACPDFTDMSLREAERDYLAENGLVMGGDYWTAMQGSLTINAVPAGSMVGDGETIFTVSGPSALASHIEGSVIGGIQFRIQVGTILWRDHHIAQDKGLAKARLSKVTCPSEAVIIREVADAMGLRIDFEIKADPEGYYQHVRKRAKALLDLLEDGEVRISEGGLRSASCPEAHDICVRACADAGIKATSNVYLARRYGLKPAGTTGHEHTQRWGSDYEAYAAVCDRIPFEVTCLLDTFSTRHSGIPSAIRLMTERPGRVLSSRPDSEPTQEGDFAMMATAMQEAGLSQPINLSGGFNVERTARFEELREFYGLPPKMVRYLYGEYLQKPHVPLPTRGGVGAVYKVSQTGSRATMKFSDIPVKDRDPRNPHKLGPKSSKPGRPVLLRLQSYDGAGRTSMPIGMTAQEGEVVPGYASPTSDQSLTLWARLRGVKPVDSPATAALVQQCVDRRLRNIQGAVVGVL